MCSRARLTAGTIPDELKPSSPNDAWRANVSTAFSCAAPTVTVPAPQLRIATNSAKTEAAFVRMAFIFLSCIAKPDRRLVAHALRLECLRRPEPLYICVAYMDMASRPEDEWHVRPRPPPGPGSRSPRPAPSIRAAEAWMLFDTSRTAGQAIMP